MSESSGLRSEGKKKTDKANALGLGSFAVENLKAGRDIIINLAAAAAALKFANTVQAFFEEYLVAETTEGQGLSAIPFGGRTRELERLDRWLNDASAPPRLLLTAPAGRGKSALLVNWVRHLEVSGRIGEGEANWNLVFFPISLRFNTHRPEIFYQGLAARLAGIVGQDLHQPHADPVPYYKDRCRELFLAVASSKKRVVVIIDGIDEALGESFDASWFIRGLGPFVRLLVSARLQVGDQDATGWLDRLDWTRGVRVQTQTLAAIDEQGVRELLATSGSHLWSCTLQPAVATSLFKLSEGEPLLLRLYIEDLQARSAAGLTVDELLDLKPGFASYFKDWITRQSKAWRAEREQGAEIDEAAMYDYLSVLSCAHGRLTKDELNEVASRAYLDLPKLPIEVALYPLRRFIIGSGSRSNHRDVGYVLSHPKLGEFLREYFGDRISHARKAFIAWGRDVVRQLASEVPSPRVPAYLLMYFGQHLEGAGAPVSSFIELVEEGWLRAWEDFEGGYQGFARDVSRARKHAAKTAALEPSEPLAFARQFRCGIILSSIRSGGSNIPGELLLACFQCGLLTFQQIIRWLEYAEEADRAIALESLAPVLPDSLVEGALDAARTIVDISFRVRALAPLIKRLPNEARETWLTDLVSAARTLDVYRQRYVLGELAQSAAEPRKSTLLRDALTLVRGMEARGTRSDGLRALAPHLTVELMDEALVIAREFETNFDRAKALAFLAPRLPDLPRAQVVGEILEASHEIGSSDLRFSVLMSLLRCLPEQNLAGVIEAAFFAARHVSEAASRGKAIVELAPHLSDELLPSALECAKAIRDEYFGALAIEGLAPHLPASLHSDAVAMASSICGPRDKARALAALAPYICANLLQQALKCALTIEDHVARAAALGPIARYLPAHDQAKAVGAAVAAAQAIADNYDRACALSSLAQFCSGADRTSLLAEALTTSYVIGGDFKRERLLLSLSSQLPRSMLGDALSAAIAIGDTDDRGRAIEALAPFLSEELLSSSLDAVFAFDDYIAHHSRQSTLKALVPYLTPALLGKALAGARTIGDTAARSRAFVALAHCQSEVARVDTIDEALRTARSVESNQDRLQLLKSISVELPEPERTNVQREALRALEAIGDDSFRLAMLKDKVADLAESLPNEALAFARSFKDSEFRAHAIASIISWLPPAERRAALSEALDATRKMSDLVSRSTVEIALSSQLDEQDRNNILIGVLDRAQLITNEFSRQRLLISLAPEVPKNYLGRVLAIARDIKDGLAHSLALTQLAPYLTEDLLGEALFAARWIFDAKYRAETLIGLIPKLSPDLLQRGLEDRTFYEPYPRAIALLHLASRRSKLDRANALDEARAIARDVAPTDRVKILASIAEQLPGAERIAILREAIDVVRPIEDEQMRSQLLSTLVPMLGANLIDEALVIAGKVVNNRDCLRALSALAEYSTPKSRAAAFDLFVSRSTKIDRRDVLGYSSAFFSVIAECDGAAGLVESRRAIADSAKWFP